jgi:hypothetical protein
MSSVAIKRTDEIRTRILDAVRERPYRPIELLQQLQSAGLTEAALKEALADLIDAELIELSPDRHIRLRQPHSAESSAAAR